MATFDSMDDAGRAIAAIDTVAEPSLLELMDNTTINAVEQMTKMGLDTLPARRRRRTSVNPWGTADLRGIIPGVPSIVTDASSTDVRRRRAASAVGFRRLTGLAARTLRVVGAMAVKGRACTSSTTTMNAIAAGRSCLRSRPFS